MLFFYSFDDIASLIILHLLNQVFDQIVTSMADKKELTNFLKNITTYCCYRYSNLANSTNDLV